MIPRFVVVGAGMAGLLSAIKLREAGFTDITVYEKADRLGGTWRENTYPGIACDVPSHLYTYSFAPNPDWSHVFSPGAEILGYLEAVAKRHGVAGLVRYGADVRRLEYDGSRWRIELSTGQRDEADVVIAATGVLHHPWYPDIDGLDEFAGPLFHSARWDHDAPLSGARLGVIGTGSSAVQITGALVDVVGELHLFQRTPQWVLAVDNPRISDEERDRYRADPTVLVGLRDELNTNFVQGFANAVVDAESPALMRLQELGIANLEEHVADPGLVLTALFGLADPTWMEGDPLLVALEILGPRGGRWTVLAGGVEPIVVATGQPSNPHATVQMPQAAFQAMLAGRPGAAEGKAAGSINRATISATARLRRRSGPSGSS